MNGQLKRAREFGDASTVATDGVAITTRFQRGIKTIFVEEVVLLSASSGTLAETTARKNDLSGSSGARSDLLVQRSGWRNRSRS